MPRNAEPRHILGAFEQAVVEAIRDEGARTLGVSLIERLRKTYRANLAMSQVYITLRRLTGKAFIDMDEESEPVARGCRRRQVFTVNEFGQQALAQSGALRQAARPPAP